MIAQVSGKNDLLLLEKVQQYFTSRLPSLDCWEKLDNITAMYYMVNVVMLSVVTVISLIIATCTCIYTVTLHSTVKHV